MSAACRRMVNRRLAGMLATTLLLGCDMGPSGSATGVWSGGSTQDHSGAYWMLLQQNGKRISGSACRMDGGHLIFSGAPVAGDFPDLAFEVTAANTAPCCPLVAGRRFSGRLTDQGQIVGQITIDGAVTEPDARFTRASTGLPAECAAAR